MRYFKKNGFLPAYYAAKERLEQQKQEPYTYTPLTRIQWEAQRREAKALQETEAAPTFSLLVPAYETNPVFLQALLDSLREQTYEAWQLVLVDASPGKRVKDTIDQYLQQHPALNNQVCYVPLAQNLGIAENTNQGLNHCQGEYICLVDHDDLLSSDALFAFASVIVEQKKQQKMPIMVYSDEDKTDTFGKQYYDHHEKYGFNLDLLLSNNYICHLMAVKTEIFQEIRERGDFDGAQDYDFILRVILRLIQAHGDAPGLLEDLREQIIHVPKVLYHWRCHEASTAQNTESKGYAYEAGRRALADFLKQCHWQGTVSHMRHLGFYQVEYEPSIWAVRRDVAAVGGRRLDRKHCMLPSIRDEKGEALYVGLHRQYSGRMHRYSLMQDVGVIDLRCAQIADFAEPILEQVLGEDVKPWLVEHAFAALDYEKHYEATRHKKPHWETLSLAFSQAVRQAGYTLVYNPKLASQDSEKQ